MMPTDGKQGEETIATAMTLSIINSDVKIPPMPINGAKLMGLAQKPIEKIRIREFVKLIEPDPGLFAMMLQLANSPYFRGVDEIFSLRAAITRVGTQEAVNAVNLYFLQRMMPNMPEIKGFSTTDYWTFSWACAVAARRLGHPKLADNALPGELYLAGLLHGIGKFIMATHHPREFSESIRKAHATGQPLNAQLVDEFGTTDNLLAAKILELWNIPSRICAAVEFYPNPESAPEEFRGLAASLQLAYAIASNAQIGVSSDGAPIDIESSWICQNPDSILSDPGTREKVILEITGSLEKKSESVTGVSQFEEEAEKPQTGPVPPKSTAQKPRKKGFFAWIKSWFS